MLGRVCLLGLLSAAALGGEPRAAAAQDAVEDFAVRAAVLRFFAAQEAEDSAAYLALWSRTARAPRPEQLKYVFESGDDRFYDIEIARVVPINDLVRVEVTVRRERTDATRRRPDGTPVVTSTRREWSLTFAREDGELKILSEGVPADDLANALLAAPTPDARALLLDAEPNRINDRLLTSLSQRASGFAQRSQFADAERAYGVVLDVARRARLPKAEGEALQNIANARYYLRNLDGALAAYDERAALERAAGNEEGLASALLGMATIRYSNFEYGTALTLYQEALALFEKLDDGPGIATALLSTGNVFYLQGDYDSAIRDYGRSRDVNKRLQDTLAEARALEGLGRTLRAQGDYAGALVAFAGVAEEGRARADGAMLGNARQSIGDVHFRLGNVDAARSSFDASRRNFETVNDLRAAGRVWQALGLTELVASRFAAAEEAYTRSIAACARSQDHICAAEATVGIAFAYAAQERYDAAAVSYRKAIASFLALKSPGPAARSEVGLSQALYGRKDFAGAIAAAARARDLSTLPDVLWRAHLAAARAHRQLKSAQPALVAAHAAVQVLRSMVEAAERLPSLRVPADGGDAYAFLAVLHAEAGDAAAAFTAVEQRRALVLRVALANNERDIARGMTPEEREEERAAAASVISIQVQIDRQLELPSPDRARIAQLNVRLTDAITARAAQQQRLFERLPELRLWRGMAPPMTAADLGSVPVPEGGAIAQFVIDNDDLLSVIVAHGSEAPALVVQTVSITRRELAELIAAAMPASVLGDTPAWRTAAGALARALPAKALAAIAGARRAIVIPDDVLWRVPFEALPSGAGYLGDDVEIVYAGSVSAMMRPPSTAIRAAADHRAFAIGAPALAQPLVDQLRETAPGWTLRVGDAPEREVRAVAATTERDAVASLVVGEAATEAALRAAPAATVLHIALPFRLNSASPLFSPILASPRIASPDVSAPPSDPADDGRLEVREVMNLAMHTQMVVLSDGASLSMRDAAAAAGTLHWAWLAAGIPSMMVARWPVNETLPDATLEQIYARLKSGAEPGAAVHGMRRAARPDGRAPLFWARWMVMASGF